MEKILGSRISTIMTLFEHIESNAIQGRNEPDQPVDNDQFIIDKVQFNFPGEILAGSVSSNILVLALKESRILWIDLDKPNSVKDQQITALYFSPLGDQLIVTCHKDNYYINSDLKPKLFTKIKDQITSVAWSNHSKKVSVLIGTVGGLVYDVVLTNDKRFEKSVVAVFTEKTPITGLYYFIIGNSLIVYISSKTHLYQYLAEYKSLEDIQFSSLLANPETVNIQEMIGGPNQLGIRIQSRAFTSQIYQSPEYLAWATVPGIYSGNMCITDGKQMGDTLLDNIQLQPYPADIEIIDFALSDYHFILLTSTNIIVVNKLEDKLIYTIPIPLNFEEKVVALFKDELKKTFWIATNQSLHELIIADEGKNIWKIFVDRKQYKEAMASNESKTAVSVAYAEYCYSQKDYSLSAELFANTNIPLEDVAMRFSQLDDSIALENYLMKKITLTKQSEYTQLTILISWLLELLLGKLEELEPDIKRHESALEKTKTFIRAYKERLHSATTYSLLRQHGREDLLLYYAELIFDLRTICELHIRNQKYKDALSVLATQRDPELFYKHSPILIQKIPHETIVIWTRCEFLVPRNLLPSMLHYQNSTGEPNRVISYLEHITRLGNRDRVIHNYLFQLYVEDPAYGLESILAFIATQADDLDLAKSIIYKLDDETELRRKLCALELCKEGNLKVEEVMQFFPDFVLIDDLKVELCEALRHYNDTLLQLSAELDDSANNSELIRKDIRNLKTKYAMIPIVKLCDYCGRNLMTKQFHVFPCNHTFHSDCLKEVVLCD
ncbi:hypothetical protein HDV01_001829 [Terramyces sp. JEL0728]|nr:hypothetical protein HDV01_001829 [Terramyces sp. JEL0728]